MNVKTGVILVLIILAALSRIIPHPTNFSPLMAIALFGGAKFDKKWIAFFVPLVAFLLSDIVLESMGQRGFYDISQLFVYGGVVLVALLGTSINNAKPIKLLGYSLSGSAIFWVVSNFGYWVANNMAVGTSMHEPGLTLGTTYLRALPFYNIYSNQLFFNAILGDILYTAILFGGYALLSKRIPALQLQNQ